MKKNSKEGESMKHTVCMEKLAFFHDKALHLPIKFKSAHRLIREGEKIWER